MLTFTPAGTTRLLERSDPSLPPNQSGNPDQSNSRLELETPRSPKRESAAAPSQAGLTVPKTPPSASTRSVSPSPQKQLGSTCRVQRSYRKPPRMAQPTFSRTSLQGAYAQRLEAAAREYSTSLNSGPLSPPPSAELLRWDDQSCVARGTNSRADHTSTDPRQLPCSCSIASPISEAAFGQHLTSPITPQASPSLERSDSSGFNLNAQIISPSDSQCSFGPSQRSSFASPTVGFESIWAEDQLGLDFSYQLPQASSGVDDSKVQPWWPPNASVSSANGTRSGSSTDPTAMYARMPMASRNEKGLQRPLSEGILTQDDSTSFAAGGLMISCIPTTLTSGSPEAPASIHDSGARVSSADMSSSSFPGFGGNAVEISDHSIPATAYVANSTPSSHRIRHSSRDSGSSHRHSHQRHSSHSHHQHRRSRTTGSRSNVGFVNFTPDDSKRLLTGVAPSGSSKTKARREKEAAEKRRRLEQAATRAVLEAGGDMAAFVREGLLV